GGVGRGGGEGWGSGRPRWGGRGARRGGGGTTPPTSSSPSRWPQLPCPLYRQESGVSLVGATPGEHGRFHGRGRVGRGIGGRLGGTAVLLVEERRRFHEDEHRRKQADRGSRPIGGGVDQPVNPERVVSDRVRPDEQDERDERS